MFLRVGQSNEILLGCAGRTRRDAPQLHPMYHPNYHPRLSSGPYWEDHYQRDTSFHDLSAVWVRRFGLDVGCDDRLSYLYVAGGSFEKDRL